MQKINARKKPGVGSCGEHVEDIWEPDLSGE